MEKCRLQGVGPDEPLFKDRQMVYDHENMLILISGKMTAWYEDLPVHAIYPNQFINSIEYLQQLQEDQNDFGWEQQIQVIPDEDCVFVKVIFSFRILKTCTTITFQPIVVCSSISAI